MLCALQGCYSPVSESRACVRGRARSQSAGVMQLTSRLQSTTARLALTKTSRTKTASKRMRKGVYRLKSFCKKGSAPSQRTLPSFPCQQSHVLFFSVHAPQNDANRAPVGRRRSPSTVDNRTVDRGIRSRSVGTRAPSSHWLLRGKSPCGPRGSAYTRIGLVPAFCVE
jgi:hypothetical protein